MKLVPIALVALSLLVGCSDPSGGGEKFVERYAPSQKLGTIDLKQSPVKEATVR